MMSCISTVMNPGQWASLLGHIIAESNHIHLWRFDHVVLSTLFRDLLLIDKAVSARLVNCAENTINIPIPRM